jgi:hypothetical protein
VKASSEDGFVSPMLLLGSLGLGMGSSMVVCALLEVMEVSRGVAVRDGRVPDVLRRMAIFLATLRRWVVRGDEEGGWLKQCASANGRSSILMVDDMLASCVRRPAFLGSSREGLSSTPISGSFGFKNGQK